MAQPVKILVCGDVEGKFTQLFNRVTTVHKKNGPFEMLICVGEFFGRDFEEWQNVVDKKLQPPLPMYILGPSKTENEHYYQRLTDGDISENITYLGSQGVLATGSKLRIAYFVKQEGPSTATDVERFITPIMNETGFKGVDILLTSKWPQGVTKFAGQPIGGISPNFESKFISQIALALRPRYHFCGLEGAHYERLPYRNHQILAEKAVHVTRFIALGKVGNDDKQKWLYAFGIQPMSTLDRSELTKQPADATECPYTLDLLNQIEKTDSSNSQQYFYDMSAPSQRNEGRKRPHNDSRSQRSAPKQMSQDKCWFCLASPDVEKHLVVSIGDGVYVTIAKGFIVPDHVLILPIGHFQSVLTLSKETLEELEKYKSALVKYFKSKGKVVVFFERNYKSQHLQIQVVPLPEKCDAYIKDTFLDSAENQNINLVEIPKHTEIQQVINVGKPYFLVELPSGDKLLCTTMGREFPLQFGREVLASRGLLNKAERADWKACQCSREEEEMVANRFRKQFEPFDFTV